MELNLQRQTITVNETVFQGYVEQPVECDALLPDYCPDIIKVLKCNASTHVDSTVVSGDKLTIEGVATAHIYYSSDQNKIRHAEYKIPFGKTVELRSAPVEPIITVVPSVDYVNCRAVNQRRIDVRGAISFSLKVVDQKERQLISDASGGGLQLKRDIIQATDVIGQFKDRFSVNEELELGYGKPQIGSVIRSDYRVHVHDHKVIAGKVVVKGDFMLHLLYQPLEEGEPEVMEYSLPLSQILDCAAADEACICDVEMFVLGCDIQPKAGEDGEYRSFAVEAGIGANITVHRHVEVPVASDCYSTKFESNYKSHIISLLRLVSIINENAMHKVSLDLPEGVNQVLDAWCEVDSMTWKQSQDDMLLDFKLTISLFAKMESGECLYFEQQSDLNHIISLGSGCGEVQFEPACDILSSTYSLVGKEKIDMRCEVLVKGCVYSSVKTDSLSEVALDESKAKIKERNRLYIYYADEGESVWDIAKRYNTSPAAIWEENAVDSYILPGKRMLLIPIAE